LVYLSFDRKQIHGANEIHRSLVSKRVTCGSEKCTKCSIVAGRMRTDYREVINEMGSNFFASSPCCVWGKSLVWCCAASPSISFSPSAQDETIKDRKSEDGRALSGSISSMEFLTCMRSWILSCNLSPSLGTRCLHDKSTPIPDQLDNIDWA